MIQERGKQQRCEILGDIRSVPYHHYHIPFPALLQSLSLLRKTALKVTLGKIQRIIPIKIVLRESKSKVGRGWDWDPHIGIQ